MSPLPVLALIVPLGMLLACVTAAGRERMAALLPLAPVPALLAAVLTGVFPASGPATPPPGLLRITLILDAPGALLMGAAALLWIAAGASAVAWLRDHAHRGRFAAWWLLTLTGGLGVFMAADLVSFYLMFALVSLPAYGLVVFDGTPAAHRTGALYLALAVLGEAFLLLGFVLLAQSCDSLLIGDAVAALPGSPAPNAAVALLIAGFGVKIGLVPLHVWMPPTYTAAPVPAAAALSGAAVKAGVIGLIRFLPFHTALPGWGGVLVVAGFFSAFYGVAIGVTRTNPKTVLACSSISQMGLIAAVLGMGLGHGDPGIALIVAFYAAHHVLVKGGLFLAIGVAPLVAARRRRWIVLLPAAVVALGLAGLPLTGGAMAKLAIKAPPSEGVVGGGVVGALGSLSAAGTALLMLHFLGRLAAAAPRGGPRPAAGTIVCVWAWLAVAAAAVVLPWALYAPLGLGAASDALAPGALAAAAWPVLLGGAAAVALRRWGHRLPHPPAGDIGGTVARAAVAAGRIGAAAGRLDAFARQWTVAGACLLAVAVLLALAMLAGS